VEGESLPAQARCHQRQQNRRWADQRHHRNVFTMRGHDQRRAGVGHGRTARFRQQADVVACLERRQQRRDGGGRGVFVEFFEMQRLQRLRVPIALRCARAVLARSTTKCSSRRVTARVSGGRQASGLTGPSGTGMR